MKIPVDGITLSRLARYRMILEEGMEKIPADVKALNMQKSCMTEEALRGLYQNPFRTQMVSAGPQPPRGDRNALDVLIALSYKWEVYLWTEVQVLAQPHSGQWRLMFNPASLLPFLINQYHCVKNKTSYSAYWMGYYRDFNLNTNASIISSTLAATIKRTRDIEGSILDNLEQFIISQRKPQ